MKRLIAAMLGLMLLLSGLAACKGGGSTAEETTARRSGDWHNKIEYDGSFYVNDTVKLRYSLDKGSITLWDDAGDGYALQKLSYDSTAANALETFTRTDVNGDGNVDLVTVFDAAEADGAVRTRYNLWLWDSGEGQYVSCALYRLITDPVVDVAAGTVTGRAPSEGFGTLVTEYRFTEDYQVEEYAFTVEGAEEVAAAIALQFTGSADVKAAEGSAVVEEEEAVSFVAPQAHISYVSDNRWYIDIGPVGLYRALAWDGETAAYVAESYLGEAGDAQDHAVAYSGKTLQPADIVITEKLSGTFGTAKAVRFTVETAGAFYCDLCRVGNDWYVSADGTEYAYLSYNGDVGEISQAVFAPGD